MKVYYSEAHRKHDPPFEVFDGGLRVPYFETPDRMDRILSALQQTDWAEVVEPQDFGPHLPPLPAGLRPVGRVAGQVHDVRGRVVLDP